MPTNKKQKGKLSPKAVHNRAVNDFKRCVRKEYQKEKQTAGSPRFDDSFIARRRDELFKKFLKPPAKNARKQFNRREEIALWTRLGSNPKAGQVTVCPNALSDGHNDVRCKCQVVKPFFPDVSLHYRPSRTEQRLIDKVTDYPVAAIGIEGDEMVVTDMARVFRAKPEIRQSEDNMMQAFKAAPHIKVYYFDDYQRLPCLVPKARIKAALPLPPDALSSERRDPDESQVTTVSLTDRRDREDAPSDNNRKPAPLMSNEVPTVHVPAASSLRVVTQPAPLPTGLSLSSGGTFSGDQIVSSLQASASGMADMKESLSVQTKAQGTTNKMVDELTGALLTLTSIATKTETRLATVEPVVAENQERLNKVEPKVDSNAEELEKVKAENKALKADNEVLHSKVDGVLAWTASKDAEERQKKNEERRKDMPGPMSLNFESRPAKVRFASPSANAAKMPSMVSPAANVAKMPPSDQTAVAKTRTPSKSSLVTPSKGLGGLAVTPTSTRLKSSIPTSSKRLGGLAGTPLQSPGAGTSSKSPGLSSKSSNTGKSKPSTKKPRIQISLKGQSNPSLSTSYSDLQRARMSGNTGKSIVPTSATKTPRVIRTIRKPKNQPKNQMERNQEAVKNKRKPLDDKARARQLSPEDLKMFKSFKEYDGPVVASLSLTEDELKRVQKGSFNLNRFIVATKKEVFDEHGYTSNTDNCVATIQSVSGRIMDSKTGSVWLAPATHMKVTGWDEAASDGNGIKYHFEWKETGESNYLRNNY